MSAAGDDEIVDLLLRYLRRPHEYHGPARVVIHCLRLGLLARDATATRLTRSGQAVLDAQ